MATSGREGGFEGADRGVGGGRAGGASGSAGAGGGGVLRVTFSSPAKMASSDGAGTSPSTP